MNKVLFKEEAIRLLGGTRSSAAQAIGCSYQAVKAWPPILSPRIADRVMAAVYRKKEAEAGGAVNWQGMHGESGGKA